MKPLLSQIPEDFLIRVMAFEKALQERTMDYSYYIYREDLEEGENYYVGQFSVMRMGVESCVRISEFDTVMLAEGVINNWTFCMDDLHDFFKVMEGANDFKYAGVKLTEDGCWHENEFTVNLEYHLPVVDEYCCDADGYAQMALEAFTLFKAEVFVFHQKLESIE